MARNYDINGLFEWAAGFIPRNLNPKTWLVDIFDVKGGPQVLNDVQELVDFHPFKMKKGMLATVVDYPNGGVNTTYVLNTDPALLVDGNEETIVTLDNFLSFWDVHASSTTSKDIVYQYATNYLGGQPLFGYTSDEALRLERDGFWHAVQNKAAGDKWFRTRDDESFTLYTDPDGGADIKVYDNWTRPLPLGSIFDPGDYIENQFKRELQGPTGITDKNNLVANSFYIVTTGQVVATRVSDSVDFLHGIGSTFEVTAAFTYSFDAGTSVDTIPDIPPRTLNTGAPNNDPQDWSDNIPAGTIQLWKIWAHKNVYGQLKSEWIIELVDEQPELLRYSKKSIPNPNELVGTGKKISDTYDGTNPAYNGLTYDEILDLEGWNSAYKENEADFIATRADDGGSPPFTTWTVEKITDESGEYTDYVYKLLPVNASAATLALEKPTISDPTSEGWQDGPQQETDTEINYVSRARKFFDGTLKTDWSELVPYTGADIYLATIRLFDGNDFKYDPNSATPTVPIPEEIRLVAELHRGLAEMWKEAGNTLSFKWEKTFDNGANIGPPATEIVSNNNADLAYKKLQADMTTEELAAEYRDDQILVIKADYITAKAYFRLTITLTTDEGDIEFVQEVSIMDISDGKDRKALEIGADSQLAIYDTINEIFNPNTFQLSARFSFLPNVTQFYWYFNNGSGYTPIDGTEANYAITGDKDNVLTIQAEAAPVAASGTITTSGTSVTGVGTLFSTQFSVGDYIRVPNGQKRKIVSIGSSLACVVDAAFSPDISGPVTIEKVEVIFDRDNSAANKQFALSTNPTDPTLADGDTHLSDYLTIAKSSSAAVGADGDDSAIAILTQEAYTTVLDQETDLPLVGELGTAGNVQTDIIVYSGDVRLDFDNGDFSVIKSPDPVGITTQAIRTSPANSKNANLWIDSGGWVAGTRTGVIELTITTSAAYGTKTITKEFSVASTRDAKGAIILDIDSDKGFSFDRNPGGLDNKTLTARLYDVTDNQQTEKDPADYYYEWSGPVPRTWTQGGGGSNGQISPQITKSSIFSNAVVVCRVSESVTGSPVLRQVSVRITDIPDAKTYRLYSAETVEPPKPQNTTDPTATQTVWAASVSNAVWASDGFELPTSDQDPLYGFSEPYKITGEEGQQGQDGGFLLAMYKNSPAGSPATIPSDTASLTQMEGNGWTYKPPNPSAGQYLWMTQRPFKAWVSEGVAVTFDGAGKPNTAPMDGSKWITPGQMSGFDGINGDLYETRFRTHTSNSSAPALDDTNRTPPDWFINPPTRAEGEFIWVTNALIDGETNALIGTWGAPSLWSGYKGDKGDGWYAGSYNSITGQATFFSNDGLQFSTGNLRGADGADGDPAVVGIKENQGYTAQNHSQSYWKPTITEGQVGATEKGGIEVTLDNRSGQYDLMFFLVATGFGGSWNNTHQDYLYLKLLKGTETTGTSPASPTTQVQRIAVRPQSVGNEQTTFQMNCIAMVKVRAGYQRKVKTVFTGVAGREYFVSYPYINYGAR